MFGTRGIARILIAGTFVMGGLRAWKRSQQLAEMAEPVASPVERRLGTSLETEQLVKVNAVAQVVGGGLFALGVLPRTMALILGASLVPTTLAGHAFWDIEDASERDAQRIQFLKNASVLGGLIFAALDTGGRPSVFWSGRRALGGLADNVSSTVTSTGHSITDHLPTS
jgi:putative oxidoreductase